MHFHIQPVSLPGTENHSDAVFDKEKSSLLLDIYTSSAQWETDSEEVYSGCGFSVTIGEERICGILSFDPIGLDVLMTYPVKLCMHRDIYYRQETFFTRNPLGVRLTKDCTEHGPATDRCKREAVDLLMGMYNDWKEIDSRKKEIVEKLRDMPEKEKAYLESEQLRVSAVKNQLKKLTQLSGDVKRCFKEGLFSQQEYIPIRHGLRDRIVPLQQAAQIPDFYSQYFQKELDSIKTVSNKKHLIDIVCIGFGIEKIDE